MKLHRYGLWTMFAFVAGCSLLNAFDDVQPTPTHDGTYNYGPESTAPGQDSGSPITEGDAGSSPVLVVGGQIDEKADGAPTGARSNVLTVLDLNTGREIGRRESFTASSIAYDGLRDLWYLFESSGNFIPGRGDKTTMHVRSLDARTGAWTKLSSLEVPTLYWYDGVAITRERLTFVAHNSSDSGTALSLVTLDTSNPSAPRLLDQQDLATTPIGAIGVRSQTGPGGLVNLLQVNRAECDGGTCPLEALRVLVPNAGTPVLSNPVALQFISSFGVPAWSSVQCGGPWNMAVMPARGDASAEVALFDPLTQAEVAARTPFSMTGGFLRRAAVDQVSRVVFVVETNGDLNLHAVPLQSGGTPTKTPLGHSGQAVYFDSATKTVLAPFNQGAGFDFGAYRLGGTPLAPTLQRRQAPDWTPPTDLRPNLLGIREPLPIACTQ